LCRPAGIAALRRTNCPRTWAYEETLKIADEVGATKTKISLYAFIKAADEAHRGPRAVRPCSQSRDRDCA
jgi:hypothetical protein